MNWLTAAGQIFATIDPEALTISFDLLRSTAYQNSSSLFDGFVVSGFDHDIASIVVQDNTTSYTVDVQQGLRTFAMGLNGRSDSGTVTLAVTLADPGNNGTVPVPATASLLLLGLGLAHIGTRRRKTLPVQAN